MPKRIKKTLENYKEIKNQLAELKNRKTNLSKKLEKIKNDVAVNQDNEFEAISDLNKRTNELTQSMISLKEMIKNGVELNRSRLEIEKELSELEGRIEKLSKIHSELAEIWK